MNVLRRLPLTSRLPLVAVFVLLGLGPVARSAHAGPSGFAYSGQGCTAVRAIFAVPVGKARPFVPDQFRIFDLGAGVATGKATITRCDRLTVGPLTGPGIFTSVTIDIEPPHGAPGTSEHGYELWHLSNRQDLAERYRAAGVRGDVVGELAVAVLAPPPLSAARGTAPWPRGSFDLGVVAPDPTAGIPTKHNESEWHGTGPRTLRTFTTFDEVEHAGVAALTAGGDFGSLLGLPAAPAAGLLRTFSFRATVEGLPPKP